MYIQTVLVGLNDRITELRTEKGLTKSQLARAIGVSPAYITLIENGTNRPSNELLIKISNALDIAPTLLDESLIDTSTSFFVANKEYIQELKSIYQLLNNIQKQNIDIDDKIFSTGINSFKSAFTDKQLNTLKDSLSLTDNLKTTLYLISEKIIFEKIKHNISFDIMPQAKNLILKMMSDIGNKYNEPNFLDNKEITITIKVTEKNLEDTTNGN